MAYTDIVQVAITLNTTTLTEQGFGTVSFLAETRVFPERTKLYDSVASMLNDGFVDGENAILAATSAFSNSPRVPQILIGRRNSSFSANPTSVSAGDTYILDITVDGVAYNFPETGHADAQGVCDAWVIAMGGTVNVDDVVDVATAGTGSSAVLQITPKDTSSFFDVEVGAGSTQEITTSFFSDETPLETLTAMSEENDDYYFVTAEDHSASYVADMASAVESLSKIYFMSTNEVDNVGAYIDNGTDSTILGLLKENNRLRTAGMFHHEANSIFPELAWVGLNAPYDAGSITWANVQPSISASEHTTLGRRLNATEKNNLNLRIANYADYDAGVTFMRTGRTSKNEWIDSVRGVDWLTQRISTDMKGLLLNQQGGKVPYTNVGRALVYNTLDSSLQQGVNRVFIDSYTISVPLLTDISDNDKNSRILSGVTFTGILSGAIHEIEIQGVLSV
jgi:hypothetical protein